MMFSVPALWAAAVAMVPLMALTAYHDLKDLRIPNWLVLLVLGAFLLTGLWGLPLDVFGWRLLQGAAVLLVGFLLFAGGLIGGGDAKMAAVLAPFVAGPDVGRLLLIYCIVALALILILRLAQQMLRHEETGWLSIDQLGKPAAQRVFPMGVIFAITMAIYLGMAVISAGV